MQDFTPRLRPAEPEPAFLQASQVIRVHIESEKNTELPLNSIHVPPRNYPVAYAQPLSPPLPLPTPCNRQKLTAGFRLHDSSLK